MYILKFDGSLTGKTKKSNYAGAAWALFDDTGKRKYNKLCDAYSRYALDYGVII